MVESGFDEGHNRGWGYARILKELFLIQTGFQSPKTTFLIADHQMTAVGNTISFKKFHAGCYETQYDNDNLLTACI